MTWNRLSLLALATSLATPAIASRSGETPPSPYRLVDCRNSDFDCLTSSELTRAHHGVTSTTGGPPATIVQNINGFVPGDTSTYERGEVAVYLDVTTGLVGEDVNDTRHWRPYDLLFVTIGSESYLYAFTQADVTHRVYSLAVKNVDDAITSGSLHDLNGDGAVDIVAGYADHNGNKGRLLVWEEAGAAVRDFADYDTEIFGLTSSAVLGDRLAGWQQPTLYVNFGTDDTKAYKVHFSDYEAGSHSIANYPTTAYDWTGCTYGSCL